MDIVDCDTYSAIFVMKVSIIDLTSSGDSGRHIVIYDHSVAIPSHKVPHFMFWIQVAGYDEFLSPPGLLDDVVPQFCC